MGRLSQAYPQYRHLEDQLRAPGSGSIAGSQHRATGRRGGAAVLSFLVGEVHEAFVLDFLYPFPLLAGFQG